jgi:hypothetical protein
MVILPPPHLCDLKIGEMKAFPRCDWDLPVLDAISLAKVAASGLYWFWHYQTCPFDGRIITFGVLYCFFVISHDRRRVLHCNVTRHPTNLLDYSAVAGGVPVCFGPRFLIFDRDAKYGLEVPQPFIPYR